MTVSFSHAGDLPALDRLPGVVEVQRRGKSVTVRGESAIVARVGRALSEAGIEPADMSVARPDLEDVYLKLVGHGEHGE